MAMDSRLFTRKVWKPEKGEYIVEVDDPRTLTVDTPEGKRTAVLIKLEDKPHVWFINEGGRLAEKAIQSELKGIVSKKKAGKAVVRVTVDEVDGKKTYRLEGITPTPDSIVVSVGIYVSDGEDGEYHLIHSDNIPIGGEK